VIDEYGTISGIVTIEDILRGAWWGRLKMNMMLMKKR